jgi:predicted O-methyltransferase YrrM
MAASPPSNCREPTLEKSLQEQLRELEAFAENNDVAGQERGRRMLNITRDTGEFLAVLVNSMNARRVLEIGTSNGYSTLWLAWAVNETGGWVRTLEYSDYKVALAAENFRRSGLASRIHQIQDDAGHALAEFADAEFDLVFLDSERSEYLKWWPDIRRTLRPGGLLVVDNATSHASEMVEFMTLVREDAGFATSLVPVGNGEFLASRLTLA